MEGRRYVVTTVIRGAPIDRVSGMVYVVDPDARRIVMGAPMPETPWRARGTNPRGGHRGGRGIATSNGRLAIANADEIHLFDHSWRPVGVLSHRLGGDIHELEPAADGLWVCSTRADSLVRLGWDGTLLGSWSWRDDPGLIEAFGYRRVKQVDSSIDYRDMRQVDLSATDLSHLNGVRETADGLLVSLGRVRFPSPSRLDRACEALGRLARGLIVGRPVSDRLRAQRVRRFGADPQPGSDRRGLIVCLRAGRPAEILVERPLAWWPHHNVLEHGRELVLCETSRGVVVGLDRDADRERIVRLPDASSFVRGLAWLDGDRFLVGTRRPAALLSVDLGSGVAQNVLRLSERLDESVHDIAPLPEEWGDPPRSLDDGERLRPAGPPDGRLH